MAYEWDQVKSRANLAKHGVDFADAVAVFEDDLALTALISTIAVKAGSPFSA